MRRAWLIVPAVIVLAVPVAAVVAANTVLGGDALRERLQGEVLRATGRALTIAGPVRLSWSLSPTIELQDVSFANPPGFSRPAMAHVEAIEATVGLLPLLAHRVEIERLLLAAPDIRLERHDGQANWQFDPPANSGAAPGPAAPAPGGARYALQIARIDLRDATVAMAGGKLALLVPRFDYDRRDGQMRGELVKSGVALTLTGTAGPLVGPSWPVALRLAGGGIGAAVTGTSDAAHLAVVAPDLSAVSQLAEFSLPPLQDVHFEATLGAGGVRDLALRIGASAAGAMTIQAASITAPSWTSPAVVQGTGLLGALPVSFDGQIGALATLATGAPTPVTLRASAGDAQLEVHGDVAPGGTLTLAMAGHAADLAGLGAAARLALPRLHDLRLAGSLTLSPVSAALTGLQVTSAEGDLAGGLLLTTIGQPGLAGALTSTKLDLDALAPSPAPAPAPARPVPTPTPAGTLQVAPPAPPAQPIPDVAIPFDALRRADASLTYRAGEVIWHGRNAHDLVLDLSLRGGRLTLDRSSVAIGDKRLSVFLVADAGGQSLATRLDGAGLPAGPVFALLGAPAGDVGTLDVRADLAGHGPTLRAVLATLTGSAGLALVDAEIDNAWLQGLVAAAKLPIETGGRSAVRCGAVALDAVGGRVTLRALSLDSAKLRLDGEGEINLADETLDLHLSPQIRLGTALSVPIRVRGNLAAPKVALDAGVLSPGRVGVLLGGPAPPDTCGPALAVARGGVAPAPAPTKPVKPADLLRSLLR